MCDPCVWLLLSPSSSKKYAFARRVREFFLVVIVIEAVITVKMDDVDGHLRFFSTIKSHKFRNVTIIYCSKPTIIILFYWNKNTLECSAWNLYGNWMDIRNTATNFHVSMGHYNWHRSESFWFRMKKHLITSN